MGSVLAQFLQQSLPRMIKLIEEGYGKEHSIPQLILAGASVDDVFVIVMFTAFTSFRTRKSTKRNCTNIRTSCNYECRNNNKAKI